MFFTNNPEIKGIKNVEIKQTLFSDDASFFTKNNFKKSLETLVQTLDKFRDISGLNLNTRKCITLKVGTIEILI